VLAVAQESLVDIRDAAEKQMHSVAEVNPALLRALHAARHLDRAPRRRAATLQRRRPSRCPPDPPNRHLPRGCRRVPRSAHCSTAPTMRCCFSTNSAG
jgi:hypothetical protein